MKDQIGNVARNNYMPAEQHHRRLAQQMENRYVPGLLKDNLCDRPRARHFGLIAACDRLVNHSPFIHHGSDCGSSFHSNVTSNPHIQKTEAGTSKELFAEYLHTRPVSVIRLRRQDDRSATSPGQAWQCHASGALRRRLEKGIRKISLTTQLIVDREKDRLSLRIANLVLTTILCGVMPAAGQSDLGSHLRLHGPTSQFNIQAQTVCEAETLGNVGAREVFSGNAYHVLIEIARAYGVPIPHMFVFSGSSNMAYIAGSTAVDGRGKILVGQQAIELFDVIALKGFLGHEMAHLVSDRATQGCNDYTLRDPQVEADADALAARTLGTGPVKAFLQRVLALTQGQNWDARQRLKVSSRWSATRKLSG